MKKIIGLFFAVCFAGVCLSGCSLFANIVLKDKIAPVALTHDQKYIVDLISNGDSEEILLFNYKTNGTYTGMEYWVEVYENGELTDSQEGFVSYGDAAARRDGRLAVRISRYSDIRCTFSAYEDGVRMEGNSIKWIADDMSDITNNGGTVVRSRGPITEPVEIEQGKEIALYISAHSADGRAFRLEDMQKCADKPELLRDYPYVQMIKCRFD